MGTKLKPGEFDCYSQAEADEPMFVLLARDPLAPILVELWAKLRSQHGCPDHPNRSHDAKVDEALSVADAMRDWEKEKNERSNRTS